MFVYDNLDRITETSGSRTATFVYNSDNTIAQFNPNFSGVFNTYTVSANGIINSVNEQYNNFTRHLEYEGLVPTKYLFDFGGDYNFEYYPNTMPSNLVKSPKELNNLALATTAIESIAQGGNY